VTTPAVTRVVFHRRADRFQDCLQLPDRVLRSIASMAANTRLAIRTNYKVWKSWCGAQMPPRRPPRAIDVKSLELNDALRRESARRQAIAAVFRPLGRGAVRGQLTNLRVRESECKKMVLAATFDDGFPLIN
jgi:hypothetical protein